MSFKTYRDDFTHLAKPKPLGNTAGKKIAKVVIATALVAGAGAIVAKSQSIETEMNRQTILQAKAKASK